MHDNVQVVAHDRPGVYATGENVAQLQNAGFNPGFSVLEAFAYVFVQAAQPRPANTAVYAVKSPRLSWGENGRLGGTAARPVERRAAMPPAGPTSWLRG